MTETQPETQANSAETQIDEVMFFKLLGESTRLGTVMLILDQGALCVCELEAALKEDQPKVSRHLSLLREGNILISEKKGKWVYYDLQTQMPKWARSILYTIKQEYKASLELLVGNLNAMESRPERCCD